MLVIIVGDDQTMRLQLARALGPARWCELLCAVPTGDLVPPVEAEERLMALLAHRSTTARDNDISRLRKRFGERVVLVALASGETEDASELAEEVDDIVTLALGPDFLHAQLVLVQRRFERGGAATGGSAGAGEELLASARRAGRDAFYVWDLATGKMTWPLATEGAGADEAPGTRREYDEQIHADDRMPLELALERHFTAQAPFAVAIRRGTAADGYALHLDRGALVGSRNDGRFFGIVTRIDDEVRAELGNRLEAQRSDLAELGGDIGEALSESLVSAFTALDVAITRAGQPQLRQELTDARGALQEALDWTRRLMALGRRQPPNPEYIALQDLVQDMVDPLARRLGSHIALEVVSRDATGIVLADPLHMETVLAVLCERAARQMPGGGKLRLMLQTTSGRDETGYFPRKLSVGRFAKLRIEDEGEPLPEEMIEAGFDPMAHGMDERLRWTIALATVRSIVLQHEGFMRALDAVNEAGEVTGAAFEIFLPLVQRAPARLRRPQTGPHVPAGRGELVLVVDDDELIRRLSERVLRESGYRVITAEDGRAAIETYAAHRSEIELVMLDIVMPEMGGRAVSERIRELDPSARFLFTSGYTMSIQDTEFVQDPRRRFLPKPFNAGQLLREVSHALDSGS